MGFLQFLVKACAQTKSNDFKNWWTLGPDRRHMPAHTRSSLRPPSQQNPIIYTHESQSRSQAWTLRAPPFTHPFLINQEVPVYLSQTPWHSVNPHPMVHVRWPRHVEAYAILKASTVSFKLLNPNCIIIILSLLYHFVDSSHTTLMHFLETVSSTHVFLFCRF